jgi:hypothetical protein
LIFVWSTVTTQFPASTPSTLLALDEKLTFPSEVSSQPPPLDLPSLESNVPSQASPMPSWSSSRCPGFAVNWQLSPPSFTPSLSSSASQTSPCASPSLFS